MGGSLSCNSSSSSSSSSLSEDMLFEILVCLPVKSLLRFKSVCKAWLSLIESSEFIHRHAITLPRSDKNNILATFIFQYRHRNPHKVLSWNMFSVTSDHNSKMFKELPMQPYYRNPEDPNRVVIVGCCNGLICLQDDEVRDVSLWNPAINQFRILPKQLTTFDGIGDNLEVYKDFAAFGFDIVTKDYKVVLVTYFCHPYNSSVYDQFHPNNSKWQYPYRVQVYSLSTDSWRPLEDLVMPTYPKGGGRDGRYYGGYLNGSYYGFGEMQTGGFPSYRRLIRVFSLLSFDFTEEIFRTTQVPDEIKYADDVTFLDEKIAIFDEGSHHCVWVLNELGVKESWTKLYRISRIPLERIGSSNNGEFIFVTDSGKIKLFNPSTQEYHVVKGLQILQYNRNNNLKFKAVVYRRSLVPVGGTRKSSGNRKSSGTVVKFVKNSYYTYLSGPALPRKFRAVPTLNFRGS